MWQWLSQNLWKKWQKPRMTDYSLKENNGDTCMLSSFFLDNVECWKSLIITKKRQHSLKPGNIWWLIFMKCGASKGLNLPSKACQRCLWENWWTRLEDSDKILRPCKNVATVWKIYWEDFRVLFFFGRQETDQYISGKIFKYLSYCG